MVCLASGLVAAVVLLSGGSSSFAPKPRLGPVAPGDTLRPRRRHLGQREVPNGGRYPSANLVHDGIWYYSTYAIDFDPQHPEFSWAVLGPVPGFRISRDYGKSWIDTPLSPSNPLFPESGKEGHTIKMGTPHFVDFGKNMEHSPDGKAYLVGQRQ